jgi:hypothetical protein
MDKIELERLAAAERRAYHKAWRAKNKDKEAETRRRYWERKALAKLNAGQEGGGINVADTAEQQYKPAPAHVTTETVRRGVESA